MYLITRQIESTLYLYIELERPGVYNEFGCLNSTVSPPLINTLLQNCRKWS